MRQGGEQPIPQISRGRPAWGREASSPAARRNVRSCRTRKTKENRRAQRAKAFFSQSRRGTRRPLSTVFRQERKLFGLFRTYCQERFFFVRQSRNSGLSAPRTQAAKRLQPLWRLYSQGACVLASRQLAQAVSGMDRKSPRLHTLRIFLAGEQSASCAYGSGAFSEEVPDKLKLPPGGCAVDPAADKSRRLPEPDEWYLEAERDPSERNPKCRRSERYGIRPLRRQACLASALGLVSPLCFRSTPQKKGRI